MWVFLNDSFLSIVADRDHKNRLLVRARAEGDIERVFSDATVEHTPRADYPYRAFVLRRVVVGAMSNAALTIDYPNFKNSVKEVDRHDSYMSVWGIMRSFQTLRELVAIRRGYDGPMVPEADDDDLWEDPLEEVR